MHKKALTALKTLLMMTLLASIFCINIAAISNSITTITILTSDREEIHVDEGRDIEFKIEIFDTKDGVITSEEQVVWKDSHGAVVSHGNVLKVPASALEGKFAASFSVTATNSKGETASKIYDFQIGKPDDYTLLFMFAGMAAMAMLVVLYSVVRSKRGKY